MLFFEGKLVKHRRVRCGKGDMLSRGLYHFDQYWGSYQRDLINSRMIIEISLILKSISASHYIMYLNHISKNAELNNNLIATHCQVLFIILYIHCIM